MRQRIGGLRARGFTLLEILVVVVIIAILTAMLVPNLAIGGHWRTIAREADTLAARVRVAQDDALMYGREWGIVFNEDGYVFVVWDAGEHAFRLPPKAEAWMQRKLADDIRISAASDSADPILVVPPAPEPAARASNAAQPAGEGAKPVEYKPSVYVLSSGEVTPFTAIFRAPDEETEGRVKIDAFGNRIDIDEARRG